MLHVEPGYIGHGQDVDLHGAEFDSAPLSSRTAYWKLSGPL